MSTKLSKPTSTHHDPAPHGTRSTAISPWATLACGRIPSRTNAEIIAPVEQASPRGDASTKIINVDTKVLKVRQMRQVFGSSMSQATSVYRRHARVGGANICKQCKAPPP